VRASTFAVVLVLGVVTARQLFAEIYFTHAVQLEKNFDWQDAKKEYEHAISWAPLYDTYYEALGRLLRKKTTLTFNQVQKARYREDAIGIYKRITKLHPYWAGTYYLLAGLHKDVGDEDQYRKYLETAIRRDPKNARFISEYGYYLLDRGDVGRAVDSIEIFQGLHFKEGIETDPCKILRRFYPFTQNINDLKRVISDGWRDHYCLGTVLGEKGRWQTAQTQFAMALEKAKPDYDTDFYMKHIVKVTADYFIKFHRFDDALSIYEESLNLNPDHKETREQVKEILNKIRLSGKGTISR